MDKVQEMRRRAAECRILAINAPVALKRNYSELADIWDRLAEERLKFFVQPLPSDISGSSQPEKD